MRTRLAITVCIASAGFALPTSALGAARRLGDRPLRPGTVGRDVKTLQRFLTVAGFRTRTDGEFGPSTSRSVKGFQTAATLDASGVVGKATVKALRAAVRSVAPPLTGGFSAEPKPKPKPKPAPDPLPAPAPPGAASIPGPSRPATVNADGTATPPPGAPQVIVDLFTAANRIATMPYRYGGGHGKWEDTGYDCSGSLSYALHGAGLLDTTLDSTGLESWGDAGAGTWITVFANKEHTYMYVAGIRFDTSGQRQAGTRWQAQTRSGDGFVVRHPAGL